MESICAEFCWLPLENAWLGTPPAVKWLGLCTSNAGGLGSIPGQGTRIPHATLHGQKKIFLNAWLELGVQTANWSHHG